jgi:hypothetical protein
MTNPNKLINLADRIRLRSLRTEREPELPPWTSSSWADQQRKERLQARRAARRRPVSRHQLLLAGFALGVSTGLATSLILFMLLH